MENTNELEQKKEEKEPEKDSKEITEIKNEIEPIINKPEKIKEENEKNEKEDEKNNISEEIKEDNNTQKIENKDDEKNKINENIKSQLENYYSEVFSKVKSVWENDRKNFGYFFQKDLYKFMVIIFRIPCVIKFKEQIALSFKFFCDYLSYIKDKLNEIPIFSMFMFNWFFNHKINLFSLYPQSNYIDEFDEQYELIGDNFFYIILKEISPEIELENPQYRIFR